MFILNINIIFYLLNNQVWFNYLKFINLKFKTSKDACTTKTYSFQRECIV